MANIQKAQEKQKEQYDRKHAKSNAFAIGEMVLQEDFIRKKRAGGKMETLLSWPISHYKVPWKRVLWCCRSQGCIPRISGAYLKPYKESPAVRYPSFCMSACVLELRVG